MKSKMEGAALGVIHSLGFNWLAEMEKQCVCIIVSIAFLNNTLSDYFFFLNLLVWCGLWSDSYNVKGGSICNSLGDPRWFNLNHYL